MNPGDKRSKERWQAVGDNQVSPSRGSTEWSTDDVSRDAKVDFWRSVRQQVFVEVSTEPQKSTFGGSISSACYGEFSVSTKAASAERVSRSRRLINRGDEDREYLFAVLPMSGMGAIEQAGQSSRFGPGQLIFYDSSIPFNLELESDYRQVIINLPADRAYANAGLKRNPSILASPIPIDGALSSVTSFFVNLAHAQATDPAGASILVPQVSSLAGSLLAYAASTMGTEDLPVLLRRERVLAYMRNNLSNPDLDAQMIATSCHMSRRSLYRLFDGSETTVSSQLRNMRIEAAQKLLTDREDASISSISREVGYASETHFYRTFRAVAGITPGEYRRLRIEYRLS